MSRKQKQKFRRKIFRQGFFSFGEWAVQNGFLPNTVYQVLGRSERGERIRGKISLAILEKLKGKIKGGEVNE